MQISANKAREAVEQLLAYAQGHGLIDVQDIHYARNGLLDALRLDAPASAWVHDTPAREDILATLLDFAAQTALLPENTQTYRDLFDTRLMGYVTPPPSQINARFEALQQSRGIEAATGWFYGFCTDIGYIRLDRVAKNLAWQYESPYGQLEITINLSKPEKDPKEIARLKTLPAAGYPACLLCPDNVGYAGRLDHPARQNLRILPLQLEGEPWYFQYSPYVYYNEHCIVLSARHRPMAITRRSFARLLDFTARFPHYFIGSNADLPIVGGSILNHDHFQGGRHTLPMANAGLRRTLTCPDERVQAGVIDWPMAALRLKSSCADALVDQATAILDAWRGYSDVSADIAAYSGDTPHNTITPIARRRQDMYELDLVLRNNRTTEEHPLGIFHPHAQLHHIKRENIGLIEVMGLFILPARLKEELAAISACMADEALDPLSLPPALAVHQPWLAALIKRYGHVPQQEASAVIEGEVGKICLQVLHDASVFKDTPDGNEALARFCRHIGFGE